MVQLVIEERRTYGCPSEPLLQPSFWGPVGAAVADITSVVVDGSGKFVAGWSLWLGAMWWFAGLGTDRVWLSFARPNSFDFDSDFVGWR